jgi:DNA-binding Lrp family transcriptional regulator
MKIASRKIQYYLLKALSDEYSRKILMETIYKAQSVEELSRLLDIPISTAYRRVKEMSAEGLLTIERTVMGADGKKYETYRSAFKGFKIDLDRIDAEMDVELNEDVANRLSRLWSLMRD